MVDETYNSIARKIVQQIPVDLTVSGERRSPNQPVSVLLGVHVHAFHRPTFGSRGAYDDFATFVFDHPAQIFILPGTRIAHAGDSDLAVPVIQNRIDVIARLFYGCESRDVQFVEYAFDYRGLADSGVPPNTNDCFHSVAFLPYRLLCGG